jgi:phospholipid/cholesterol/gamma-HCH transport system permease protein
VPVAVKEQYTLFQSFFLAISTFFLFMLRFFKEALRPPYELNELLKQCYLVGYNSLPLVGITGFIMGLVLTIQSRPTLAEFGAESWLPAMISVSIVREIGPVITALICAGKVGSGIGAELASMKVTEQIDAMEIMGVNSANYLILPKVVAFMVMMPLLVTLSMFMGLVGGYGISAITNVLPVSEYLLGIQYAFIPFYVWYSFIKTIVFAFVIASMASYYGYYARGGALEVGKASTKAVVNSSIVILLLDVVLTNLMLN